jgi:hypothetical protein
MGTLLFSTKIEHDSRRSEQGCCTLQQKKTHTAGCAFPKGRRSYPMSGTQCSLPSCSLRLQVLTLCRKMTHDDRFFPDPNVFRPKRFMGNIDIEGTNDHSQGLNGFDCDVPSSLVFGFGRRCARSPDRIDLNHENGCYCRICPGRFFADAILWLTISNMLAVFNFSPPVDMTGRPYSPEVHFTSETSRYRFFSNLYSLVFLCLPNLFFSRPSPFKCTFNARGDRSVELIRGAPVA